MFGESAGLDFARPRLVLSRCLDLEPCRYNGAVVQTPFVRRLEPFVELLPVCPEVEIGLGVPRAPIRLVGRAGGTALVQPSTGRDLTREMTAFADGFLDGLADVDGFLLKARSPSCGVHGVKVFPHADTEAPEGREAGMFARAVLARFPDHPTEHEARLTNPRLRDHFLVRLFALADLRRAEGLGTPDALAALHRRFARTRQTFGREHAATLDEIAARATDTEAIGRGEWSAYARAFRRGLSEPARESVHLRVIAELVQAVREQGPCIEWGGLARLIASYAEGTSPRAELLGRLRELGADSGPPGFDAYLNPYPAELALSP